MDKLTLNEMKALLHFCKKAMNHEDDFPTLSTSDDPLAKKHWGRIRETLKELQAGIEYTDGSFCFTDPDVTVALVYRLEEQIKDAEWERGFKWTQKYGTIVSAIAALVSMISAVVILCS